MNKPTAGVNTAFSSKSNITGPLNKVVKNLEPIDELDRSGCLEAWHRVYGRPPPRYLSEKLMKRALGYDCQCKAHGGLNAVTRRALVAIAAGKSPLAAGHTSALRPGTCLVREWSGRTWQVEVMQNGFRMDGKLYRSLTAVAKHITGANWSGPRFFGLT